MEKIIGKVIMGKLDQSAAGDMVSAITIASRLIQCPVCGVILDRSRVGWLESAGNPIPQSYACIDCFNDALPRLQSVVKTCKLQDVRYIDSSKLEWGKIS